MLHILYTIVIFTYICDTWLLHKCYDELITILLLFMVLIFEWVLKFRIWMLTVIIGTYVYGILVIDGYLCSRVYGMLCFDVTLCLLAQAVHRLIRLPLIN